MISEVHFTIEACTTSLTKTTMSCNSIKSNDHGHMFISQVRETILKYMKNNLKMEFLNKYLESKTKEVTVSLI